MRKALLLFCALTATVLANAQVLLVDPGADDPLLLHFNPEFIARNGVKSVSGQVWIKPDGRPMIPQDRFFLYRFGDGGLLGYSNNSFGKPGSGIDTASVMYSYDASGHLLQELHNDINGYFALRTQYDGEGRPVHVTNVRMENLSSDRYHFVEGTNTIISDERYQYTTLNDTMWRKTFLNDRGRPYQEETYTKDKLGYLRSIEPHNLITQRRGRTSFIYDAKGRLAQRIEQTDLASPANTMWEWTYDTAGDPLTRDLSRNGVLMRHSEYLYAEGTLFLKAIITKNNETGLIEILRYDTSR
ncbi:MAG: hypothetical protein ABI373_05830 [Flavobacteriales bacterium]